ncbi:hCG1813036 [Homo sapiens]|nr:RecName: Full=Putative uncharacterized protein C14orf144; Flags: Precursor [Homo sapiens]EAW81862.1 hCG1813036 [Homo sapiens]
MCRETAGYGWLLASTELLSLLEPLSPQLLKEHISCTSQVAAGAKVTPDSAVWAP